MYRSGKVRVAIARASDFYGPHALLSAMGERLFYPALNGNAVQVLGNPDMLHTYNYMPDVGSALAILGEREEAPGQIWHVPAVETVTTRKFRQTFGDIATPLRDAIRETVAWYRTHPQKEAA